MLNALLITLIAWFAATLTWRVLAPTPDVPPVTSNNLIMAAANTTPQVDLALISRLFGGGQSDGATTASSLPYKLRGVIGAGKGVDAAAIFAGGGAKDVVVRVGDELQAGVKLVEVQADFALVDNHGRQERIELDAKPALKLDAPGASTSSNDLIKPVNHMQANVSPQAGGEGQSLAINMPRAKLIAAMQSGNVAEWASGLRTDPRKGIRVEPGSAPGLVQTLQLQPGDVMQRINGRVLSQPGDITLVYNEFSQKNKIQLELLRHDRALTLDYTLQP